MPGSAGGRERAGMKGRDAMADRWYRRHDVSNLMVGGAGEGRCFSCCPRRNVSMMRIGPPQQGHGCLGDFGSSGLVLRVLMASMGMSGTARSSRIRAIL